MCSEIYRVRYVAPNLCAVLWPPSSFWFCLWLPLVTWWVEFLPFKFVIHVCKIILPIKGICWGKLTDSKVIGTVQLGGLFVCVMFYYCMFLAVRQITRKLYTKVAFYVALCKTIQRNLLKGFFLNILMKKYFPVVCHDLYHHVVIIRLSVDWPNGVHGVTTHFYHVMNVVDIIVKPVQICYFDRWICLQHGHTCQVFW